MLQYYEGMGAIYDSLESDARAPAEALLGFCRDLSEYVRANEGLERNLLSGHVVPLDRDEDFAKIGAHNFNCLKSFIARATGLRDAKEIGFRAISLMSCPYYPFVLGAVAASLVGRTLAVPS